MRLLGALVPMLLFGVVFVLGLWVKRNYRHRKAVGESTAGLSPTVHAAIRLVDSNAGWWRRRWRHGFVTVSGHDLYWRPLRPRPGPPVSLAGVRVAGTRRTSGWEHIWLWPGMRIYELVPTGVLDERYDLAVLPESVEFLLHLQP